MCDDRQSSCALMAFNPIATERLREAAESLWYNVNERHENTIASLLLDGADPNVVLTLGKNTIPQSLLFQYYMLAVDNRSRQVINSILELFAGHGDFNPNYINESGLALLHVAASCATPLDVVGMLLKLCPTIDVNLLSINIFPQISGYTPLHLALHNLNWDLVRLLFVEGGANPNIPCGEFKLNAIQSVIDDVVIPKELRVGLVTMFFQRINNSDDLGVVNYRGDTLLHLCIDPEVCDMLLRMGSSPLVRNKAGFNAIQVKAKTHNQAVQDLMERWMHHYNATARIHLAMMGISERGMHDMILPDRHFLQ